jgi:hypothetical protein
MENNKICTKCKKEKPFEEYTKNKRYKNGLEAQCRECLKERCERNRENNLLAQKKWRENNKDYQKEWAKDNEKYIEYKKKYYEENKEKYITRKQEWRKNNPEREVQARRNYIENNKEKLNEYHREWKKKERVENPQYRLTSNMRGRIRKELNDFLKIGKNKSTIAYVGCNMNELKDYIESKFSADMDWPSYGKTWEIDHIIPCKAWDLTNDFENFCCWNYRNLQPLLIAENRRKKDYYKEENKIAYVEICRTLYQK